MVDRWKAAVGEEKDLWSSFIISFFSYHRSYFLTDSKEFLSHMSGGEEETPTAHKRG